MKEAIDENTRAIFCETVSNPALEISPLEELAKVAKEAGIPLIVDDTFTTPYLCKPFSYGASIVCHSLTKWTGGHGTGIGGIVVDAGTFDWSTGKHPLFVKPDTSYGGLRWGLDLPESLSPLAYILRMRTVPLRNLGACLSPDNAWMFCIGIETLPLRMDRHCENALKVAEFLNGRLEVDWVKYPGLPNDKEYEKNLTYLGGKGGSLVVFEVKGGAEKGKKFIDVSSVAERSIPRPVGLLFNSFFFIQEPQNDQPCRKCRRRQNARNQPRNNHAFADERRPTASVWYYAGFDSSFRRP